MKLTNSRLNIRQTSLGVTTDDVAYVAPTVDVESSSIVTPDEDSRVERDEVDESLPVESPSVELSGNVDLPDVDIAEGAVELSVASGQRRSRRQVSQPAWMRSGEYDL